MPFKCKNCGYCCKNTTAQINLTLGDIKRISGYLNIPFEKIFGKYIRMAPFASSETVYDYELGLIMPCNFRINKKCSIYPARPLNCRLFPYWILAEAPDDEIKNIITKKHKCMKLLSITLNEKNKYKKYKDEIGKILLDESKITDDFIEANDFKKNIDLLEYKEYQKLLKKNLDKIKLEKNKIKLCIKFNKNDYKSLTKLITNETKQNIIEDENN